LIVRAALLRARRQARVHGSDDEGEAMGDEGRSRATVASPRAPPDHLRAQVARPARRRSDALRRGAGARGPL